MLFFCIPVNLAAVSTLDMTSFHWISQPGLSVPQKQLFVLQLENVYHCSCLFFFHCRVINRYFSWRAVNSHYTGLSLSCFFFTEVEYPRDTMLGLRSLLHTPAGFGLWEWEGSAASFTWQEAAAVAELFAGVKWRKVFPPNFSIQLCAICCAPVIWCQGPGKERCRAEVASCQPFANPSSNPLADVGIGMAPLSQHGVAKDHHPGSALFSSAPASVESAPINTWSVLICWLEGKGRARCSLCDCSTGDPNAEQR